ncbi:MAG TPA: relaxase/mobilization nuclease domain-containing protein [Puia sp.]|nr:relaxase/mobilization nuclease domain-containing protein [Puia sp.]
MVAVISTTASLSKILNYNEKKVQQGVAEFIHAGNFLGEKMSLNFRDKQGRFQRLNALNTRSKVNMLHVSLNFDPSENISNEKLMAIADRYMEGIGFRNQPYLVYRHHDSGHPHIHIVSSLITPEGKRIRTQNMGLNQSEKARKESEKEFNLVRAEGRKSAEYKLKPVDVQKIQYGKPVRLKQAMQHVLQMVINEYKFSSIHELNAVLGLYNLVADRGGKESRIYKSGGLVYQALDEKGNKVGVPIKASDFYFKPTLARLARTFEENKEVQKKTIAGIRGRIDWTLLNEPINLKEFNQGLKKEDIHLVIRQNDRGIIYGLTYVDFKTKTVLNGSDLGKVYSAKGLLERLGHSDLQTPTKIHQSKVEVERSKKEFSADDNQLEGSVGLKMGFDVANIFSELMKPEEHHDEMPLELRMKRKRKKR